MNTIKEDLLLHPVRVRILLAAAGRKVTAQQLASELPDIPQASLYRNINTLAAAGILQVVRERRVHNTVEKTYALPEQGTRLTVEDLKNARPEDYLHMFTQYLGLLLGYYTRYVQKGSIDFTRDHATFQMTPLYLNQAEIQELGQALTAALQPFLNNAPSPDRQRHILEFTTVPDVTSAPETASSATSRSTDGMAHPQK